jgi:DNA repair protein RadC
MGIETPRGVKIKDIPKFDRPREKAFRHGLKTLSNVEVLAIVIGQGTKGKNAIEIASDLLYKYRGLVSLSKAGFETLSYEKGLSKISSLKICAMFELFERTIISQYEEQEFYLGSEMIFHKYVHYLDKFEEEIFILIMLTKNNKIIKEQVVAKGQGNIEFNIRNILLELLNSNAYRYILVHNHPSGVLEPSEDDIISTAIIAKEARKLGVKLLDHIILSKEGYYSFDEHGLLK